MKSPELEDFNENFEFTPSDQGFFNYKLRKFTSDVFCRGENFKLNMKSWFETPICRKFAASLYERTSGIKSLPCSYRTLHHWEDHGLIECGRESEKGWRKFNLIEEVWINVIGDLREFGFSLDKIFNCKSLFFEKYSEEFPIPLMEYYLWIALGWNEPIFLIVFNDGGGIPFSYQELKSATKIYDVPDHVRININKILKKIGVPYYTPPKFPIEAQLRSEEVELLLLVRMGEYKSVTIHNKNGSISRIEATKDCDASIKIGDVLRSHDYQEIQLKKQNGKVVTIKQTVSMKPNKESMPLIN